MEELSIFLWTEAYPFSIDSTADLLVIRILYCIESAGHNTANGV